MFKAVFDKPRFQNNRFHDVLICFSRYGTREHVLLKCSMCMSTQKQQQLKVDPACVSMYEAFGSNTKCRSLAFRNH